MRQAVQGAFANSELPSSQQVAAAGYAPEEERRIMPTFFALHDASFFEAPAMTGLEARRSPVPAACSHVYHPARVSNPSGGRTYCNVLLLAPLSRASNAAGVQDGPAPRGNR